MISRSDIRHPAWSRFGIGLATLLLVALAFGGPRAEAAFEPGVVKVSGYNWTDPFDFPVPLEQDGQTYSVYSILEEAEPDANGQFDLDTIPGITVRRPNGSTVKCTGDQVRAKKSVCPLFYSTATETFMRVNGGNVRFTSSPPVIWIDRPRDMVVTVTPKKDTITSGESVDFKAGVTNQIGNLTYKWSFGDGSPAKTTTQSSISHKFTGVDKQFSVILTVTSDANTRKYYGSSLITIGKVKKKPKKQEKKKPEDDNTGNYGSGYYDPFTEYYDDGSGTGTGSGIPSTGSPAPSNPDPDQRQEPPVDDSGETVTGQLIDPTQVATVVPPSDESAAGNPTEQAAPADEGSGGGGISGGVKTALGIGALLGLGGLAEAGAFSGALRRFRLRP